MGFQNPASSGPSTPISVTNGGLGLTSATAGDMLYASGSNVWAKLAKGSGLQRLRMNAGATAPEWYTDAGSTTNFAALHVGADGTTSYHATLAAAKAAAVSGDTIEVFAGTYNEKNLLKNGVNWVFHDGAFVTYTSNGNGAIFDDGANGANGAVTCIIEGYGSFTNSGSGTGNLCINIENGSSDITFSAKLVKSTVTDAADVNAGMLTIPWVDVFTSSAFGSNALYIGGSATVSGAIRSITSTSGSAGKGIWSSGTTTIFANEIMGVGKGVLCDGGVLSLDVYSVSSTFNLGVHVSGGVAQVRTFSISTGGSGQECVKITGGSAYITADKISATGNNGCIWGAGGTCYVNADEIICSSDYEPCVFTDSGTLVVEAFLIKTTSGSQYAIGGTGGTLRVVGSRAQNSGANGVAAQAGGQTLILEGAITLLSASGATDGITAGSAQNVKLYGFVCSNKAKNANVTFQVAPAANQVFSDANVV